MPHTRLLIEITGDYGDSVNRLLDYLTSHSDLPNPFTFEEHKVTVTLPSGAVPATLSEVLDGHTLQLHLLSLVRNIV